MRVQADVKRVFLLVRAADAASAMQRLQHEVRTYVRTIYVRIHGRLVFFCSIAHKKLSISLLKLINYSSALLSNEMKKISIYTLILINYLGAISRF